KATSPAIELPDGKLLCGSFQIAEYLDATYPDRPSLFSGSKDSSPAVVKAGKAYAFMMDQGLGDSDPEWAVWLDIIVDDIQKRVVPGPNRDYFVSDAKWGPDGLKKMLARKEEQDLLTRVKANVLPLIASLKNRPGEFLQGEEPGFVDYVVFGRYAMCRNNNPKLAKEIWEDQGKEIAEWVE
ncbi:hypothetical protein HDU99_008138, partial [Rhizoclosmatium hyalinum]